MPLGGLLCLWEKQLKIPELRVRFEFASSSPPIRSGQGEIHQDQVGQFLTRKIQSHLPVVRFQHLITSAFKEKAHHFTITSIIFNKQKRL